MFLLKHYSGDGFLNVGTGKDLTIAEFAALVAESSALRGEISFDPSRPDGTPRKLLDVSQADRARLAARIGLREGLAAAYADFLSRPGRGS